MNVNVITAELADIETQVGAVRAELKGGQRMSPAQPSRAFVEAHAARLLKHAAKLYAEACRVTEESHESKR